MLNWSSLTISTFLFFTKNSLLVLLLDTPSVSIENITFLYNSDVIPKEPALRLSRNNYTPECSYFTTEKILKEEERSDLLIHR